MDKQFILQSREIPCQCLANYDDYNQIRTDSTPDVDIVVYLNLALRPEIESGPPQEPSFLASCFFTYG
jgi:hypothetical protein